MGREGEWRGEGSGEGREEEGRGEGRGREREGWTPTLDPLWAPQPSYATGRARTHPHDPSLL